MDYKQYKNWKIKIDNDFVLWLGLDKHNERVNTLDRNVLEEFEQLIEEIIKNKPQGVVIYSCKSQGFIAGADIKQFTLLKNREEGLALVRYVQKLFDTWEQLPMPTVAMIKGFCLGGGTELALACNYRVAQDQLSTRIGLPEVKLGINPGWGGTVRLPRLIGPMKAMSLILSGRLLAPRAAKKLGIVNAVTKEAELENAAKYFITKKPKPKSIALSEKIASFSFIRPLVANQIRKTLNKKIQKSHYPAPFAIVDNWVKYGAKGEAAMVNEAETIADLLTTPTSQNLVRVFFLQEKLKAQAKSSDFKAEHVHVIGAGTMGGDIAAWCALRGLRVTLQDQTPEAIAPAVARAYQLFKKKLRVPFLIKAAMDRLQPDCEGFGVRQADVVIEAIFENLEAKQSLFKSIETELKPGAIMASNTSSIPLNDISAALNEPERLIGIHYFNPVAKMPLVEIVHTTQTHESIINNALAFTKQIGKLPLLVTSTPGFLVNRVLMPYLLEAVYLLDEGFSAQAIDQCALDFGMPMGPITLADTIGLDICLSVAKNLTAHFGGKVPEKLQKKVDRGELGCKSERGFYHYKKGKKASKTGSSGKAADKDISHRLVLRFVNEAMSCLREKVVAHADFLDAGIIFGTGFAPFRGGPMHYASSVGTDTIIKDLEELEKKIW